MTITNLSRLVYFAAEQLDTFVRGNYKHLTGETLQRSHFEVEAMGETVIFTVNWDKLKDAIPDLAKREKLNNILRNFDSDVPRFGEWKVHSSKTAGHESAAQNILSRICKCTDFRTKDLIEKKAAELDINLPHQNKLSLAR